MSITEKLRIHGFIHTECLDGAHFKLINVALTKDLLYAMGQPT